MDSALVRGAGQHHVRLVDRQVRNDGGDRTSTHFLQGLGFLGVPQTNQRSLAAARRHNRSVLR